MRIAITDAGRKPRSQETVMNPAPMHCDERNEFQLRFQSLFDAGRAYAFPCDAAGQVDMDALGDRARNSYLYARAVVGCEFSRPVVQPCRAS
jgi:hypothetical protein